MHHHTRIFKSGNSLAIRIPKSFDLHDQQEVEIFMRHGELVIRVVPTNLADALTSLIPFPDDVKAEIDDLPPQKRDF